jgi:NAD(P)-dependent dehydrogenase (short-subunit alcohol dehydrogenase family)
MGTNELEGRRLVVIGASAGIGRSAALGAIRAGADVVLGARRAGLLEECVAEAGGGRAIALNLQDVESCTRFAEEAAAALGGIDAVLFTAGTATLAPIELVGAEAWAATFATNVLALNLLLPPLLPHLEPAAFVAALSSEAVGAPRYALGAYGASKAALEHSLRSWRLEHPEVRFSTVTVGATVPTDFGSGFETDILMKALEAWAVQGLAQTSFMDRDEVAAVLLDIIGTALAHPGIGFEHLVLRSPAGLTASTDEMVEAALGS